MALVNTNILDSNVNKYWLNNIFNFSIGEYCLKFNISNLCQ